MELSPDITDTNAFVCVLNYVENVKFIANAFLVIYFQLIPGASRTSNYRECH